MLINDSFPRCPRAFLADQLPVSAEVGIAGLVFIEGDFDDGLNVLPPKTVLML